MRAEGGCSRRRRAEQVEGVGVVVDEVDALVLRGDGQSEERAGPAGDPLRSRVRMAACVPSDWMSSRLPFPPLTVRTSPSGATVRPRGRLVRRSG